MSYGGKNELSRRSESTAAILHEAGAAICIVTDHPVVQIKYFLTQIERVCLGGLPLGAAFDAITINPAKAINLQDRIGKIQEGYDADIVVLNKQPGEGGCVALVTFVNGKIEYIASDNVLQHVASDVGGKGASVDRLLTSIKPEK